MAETVIFGSQEPDVQYTKRRAAYLIVTNDGSVATVKPRQKHFLPGGGSLPCEAPEDTIVREVREELARGVRLTRRIGEAVQYFYSAADERHYRMRATFFAGEFTHETRVGTGEHELHWLPATEAEQAFFHACHAWAVRSEMKSHTPISSCDT
jgi:8-oxo-dGTP pyrophosphatase MutT (NUDIX family)